MGSSVASTAETTINTSTESASTLATNVTGTDTSTCDSLDLGEHYTYSAYSCFAHFHSNQSLVCTLFSILLLKTKHRCMLFT